MCILIGVGGYRQCVYLIGVGGYRQCVYLIGVYITSVYILTCVDVTNVVLPSDSHRASKTLVSDYLVCAHCIYLYLFCVEHCCLFIRFVQ